MITFVQVQTNSGIAATTATVSITPTTGNLLVLIISGINGLGDPIAPISVSDSNGNTYLTFNSKAASANCGICGVVVPSVVGGAMTITANFTSATTYSIAAFEYSGADVSGNLGFSAGDSGSGTTSDSWAYILFQANALFLAFTTADTGLTLTQTSSFTERVNIVGFSPLSVVEGVGFTGSLAGTWSLSMSANWAGLALAWKPYVPPPPVKCLLAMDIGVI